MGHMVEHPKFTSIGKKRYRIDKPLAPGKERLTNRFPLASGRRKCFYGNQIAIQTAEFGIEGLLRSEFFWYSHLDRFLEALLYPECQVSHFVFA
jgi:hypothetical protein